MSIYSDLMAYLKEDATVQAAVTRIAYYRMPQSSQLPYMVLKPESESRGYHSGGSDGLVNIRLAVDIAASTFEQANTIKESLRDRLDTFRGDMGSSFVQSCFMADTQFTDELPTHGNERGDVTCRVIFSITAQETKPSVR